MITIRRFCFKMSVASGTQVIGYLNLLEIVFLIALYSSIGPYSNIALVILPILCCVTFNRMMRKDCAQKRRKNFCMHLVSKFICSAVQVSQLTQARINELEVQRGGNRPKYCPNQTCVLGGETAFLISTVVLGLKVIW